MQLKADNPMPGENLFAVIKRNARSPRSIFSGQMERIWKNGGRASLTVPSRLRRERRAKLHGHSPGSVELGASLEDNRIALQEA